MVGKTSTFLLVGATVLAIALITLSGLTIDYRGAPAQAAEDRVFVGAGDIARCEGKGDEATADLLDEIDGTVFTLGDNAYQEGTPEQFAKYYHPTWGRHKARTMPAVGNHDYETPGAGPYFEYFGARAGPGDRGYYSYDLGDWHIVVLNSNCSEVQGGCGPGSPQERWLRADLEANPAPCTAATFHHPRFSSGIHGQAISTTAFWDALYDAGADVVLSGHNHNYERFAPQDPTGAADPKDGIRQFVVGTGGGILRGFVGARPNSEVQIADTYGVLKMTLRSGGYDWEFITAPDGSTADSGSARCSGADTPSPSDTTPPSVQSPQEGLPPHSTLGISGSVPTHLEWSATDDASGVARYELQQSVDGGPYRDVRLSSPDANAGTLGLQPGTGYQHRVRAADGAGNVSDWATGERFYLVSHQESDGAVTYAGDWAEQTSPVHYGGARYVSGDESASATFSFDGSRSVTWVSSQAPNRGIAEVWLDGVRVDAVDLYAETWRPRTAVFSANELDPSVPHTLEIRVTGTKNEASRGSRVHVDGFVALR